VGVVVDEGDRETRVSQAMAAGWGVAFDEVLAVALANAAARRAKAEPVSRGVFLVRDPVFAAAMWLSDPVLRQAPIPKRALAVAPLRDYVIVGPNKPATATIMAGVMGDMLQAGEALTTVTPHLLGPGGWEGVSLESCGAPARLATSATRSFSQQIYNRQKTLLETRLEQTGEDALVPAVKLFQAASGQVLSVTTWGDGFTCLLPVTDMVSLVSADLSQAAAPWGRVMAEASDLLRPCGLSPERWRTIGFPSRERLAALAGR
jgi:hypothetical protein